VYRHIIIYAICYMMFLVTSSANILLIRVLFNVHMVHQFPPTSRSNPKDLTLFINSWVPVVFEILLWINYHTCTGTSLFM